MSTQKFQTLIRFWYRARGRHDLPWRKTRNPYRILVSEVMLQQTQVSRVIRKYPEFIRRFPTMRALGRAPLKAVLLAWQGMGYNRRAVYLKRFAQMVTVELGGRIPNNQDALERLPGIGPGTAGAIAAFAFNRRVAFLETNIRRVYIHFFFARRRRIHDAEIIEKISRTLPRRSIRTWYYALMDYGAAALKDIANPNRRSAHYARQSAFSDSRRELRGRILAQVLKSRTLPLGLLARRTATSGERISETLAGLVRDGLVTSQHGRIAVPT